MDIFLTVMLKVVAINSIWLLGSLNMADQGTDFITLYNLN